MGRPFLILQLRPETPASDNEFEAFLKFGGLKPTDVRRVRMEADGLPKVNLNDYSAIIVGGGPSNISDPPAKQPPEQRKFEPPLFDLIDQVIAEDLPFLGACYGIGALAKVAGGKVSKEKYGEDVGAVDISLTKKGQKDPLTAGLPKTFRAFVGHKEACQDVPKQAVLLASSADCPVQMIRVKNNVYGTQFHPELDSHGLALRIKIYKDAGYFPPEDADMLIDKANQETVTVPEQILQRFVQKSRR